MSETPVILAYIDPGSASFVILSVLGFMAAVGYVVRGWLSQLKQLVFRRRPVASASKKRRARPAGRAGRAGR